MIKDLFFFRDQAISLRSFLFADTKKLLDSLCNRIKLSVGKVIINHLTVDVNEEFSKVPWDLTNFIGFGIVEAGVASNKAEYVMGIVTIDINFVEKRVASSIWLSECLDPCIIIGLLVSELVAWECNNLKAFVTVLVVDLSHPSIVTVSKSSKACYVCDEGNFFPSCVNTDLR